MSDSVHITTADFERALRTLYDATGLPIRAVKIDPTRRLAHLVLDIAGEAKLISVPIPPEVVLDAP